MSATPPSPCDGERDGSPRRNQFASIGLILGVVSIIVNPVLVIGIAAIGVSAVGFNRASLMSQFGFAPIGRGKAILGMILGLLGIIASVAFKNSLY